MISLIEVVCPHCGAPGQISLPPIGAIVIGPCPQCEELVVVFCGKVLPLNKEAMLYGTNEQKREHLMEVLTGFLEEKLSQITFDAGEGNDLSEPTAEKEGLSVMAEEEAPAAPTPEEPAPQVITESDLTQFVTEELKLLDNKDYFKAVFG